MRGISICILTYNVFFYNRLAIDQIRKLTNNNMMKHGSALDFLTRRANYPICACLCSDAFPVSPEWIVPALYLDDKVILTGIKRTGNRKKLCQYPCPSYMFGWTEWLKRHSFVDNWPNWDTGERLGRDCLDEGYEIKTWQSDIVNLEGFSPKQCDYNGWVYHTWWSGRKQTIEGIEGVEFEEGYHEYSVNMLRKQFNLDY
jgi:hypothetical protein